MKQKRQFCTDKSYNPQQRQNNNLNASFITDIVKKKRGEVDSRQVLWEILQCFSYTFTNWVVKKYK